MNFELAVEALAAACDENYDALGDAIASMNDEYARQLWIALREVKEMIEATDAGDTDRPWDQV